MGFWIIPPSWFGRTGRRNRTQLEEPRSFTIKHLQPYNQAPAVASITSAGNQFTNREDFARFVGSGQRTRTVLWTKSGKVSFVINKNWRSVFLYLEEVEFASLAGWLVNTWIVIERIYICTKLLCECLPVTQPHWFVWLDSIEWTQKYR